MSWVYRRAGTAMFITSCTTCAAFLATLITPIPTIASFGVLTSIVILMDYIWVTPQPPNLVFARVQLSGCMKLSQFIQFIIMYE